MLPRPEPYLQAKLWEPQTETEQWKNVVNSIEQTSAIMADILIQDSASETEGLRRVTSYGKMFSFRV